MMLDYCKLQDLGNRLRDATTTTLKTPVTGTRNPGGKLSTTDFAAVMIDKL